LTPEASAYLTKARQCLANAKASLGFGLSNDAGRGAYLAAYHASQAFIFEQTGKAAKTHQGVQSEFHRLADSTPKCNDIQPVDTCGFSSWGRLRKRKIKHAKPVAVVVAA